MLLRPARLLPTSSSASSSSCFSIESSGAPLGAPALSCCTSEDAPAAAVGAWRRFDPGRDASPFLHWCSVVAVWGGWRSGPCEGRAAGNPTSWTGPAGSLPPPKVLGSIPVSALTTSSRCIAVYKTGVLSSRRKLQCEKISYWCFQSLDTLPCFSTYLMYINEACACLRTHALWSCTQGSVPIQLLHHHRCHLPLRATPPATPTSHAPLPSAPPPAWAHREALLPGGPPPALLFVSENIHRGFWISEPRRQKDIFHYRT